MHWLHLYVTNKRHFVQLLGRLPAAGVPLVAWAHTIPALGLNPGGHVAVTPHASFCEGSFGLRKPQGVWGEEPDVGTETECMCLCHFPKALGRGQKPPPEGHLLCCWRESQARRCDIGRLWVKVNSRTLVWELNRRECWCFCPPFYLLVSSGYSVSLKRTPAPSSLHSRKTKAQRKGNSCQA